jgi:hypothetical protein
MAFAQRAQQPARPRLLQALIDSWQQTDVRRKLLFTFAMLVVFRFVAHIPIPGVNADLLKAAFEDEGGVGAFLGQLNLFSGGALRQLSVAALGVYPYITASIIMQILIPIVPACRLCPARVSRAGTAYSSTRTGSPSRWPSFRATASCSSWSRLEQSRASASPARRLYPRSPP